MNGSQRLDRFGDSLAWVSTSLSGKQTRHHAAIDYSHDRLWSYDAAVLNLIPGRRSLRRPQPDYAFGLKYNLNVPDEEFLARAALSIKKFTEPAVDIICPGKLTMPFLVGEAKSPDGSLFVAIREMCNALIKCHDNLSALKLSEKLVIYSFVHVGLYVELYFSVSVLETNEKGMAITKQVISLPSTKMLTRCRYLSSRWINLY